MRSGRGAPGAAAARRADTADLLHRWRLSAIVARMARIHDALLPALRILPLGGLLPLLRPARS